LQLRSGRRDKDVARDRTPDTALHSVGGARSGSPESALLN
jgi:hypothetical protein